MKTVGQAAMELCKLAELPEALEAGAEKRKAAAVKPCV